MDKIATQDEYKNAIEVDMDLDKKIIKLGELNELLYEDLILSINPSSSVGKVDLDWWGMQRVQIFPKETAMSHETSW